MVCVVKRGRTRNQRERRRGNPVQKCGSRSCRTGSGCAFACWACTGRGGAKGIRMVSRYSTEHPHARSGVAAFISARSKTPCITPSMKFSSGKGVVRGRRGQQLGFALGVKCIELGVGPAKSARDTRPIHLTPYNP